MLKQVAEGRKLLMIPFCQFSRWLKQMGWLMPVLVAADETGILCFEHGVNVALGRPMPG